MSNNLIKGAIEIKIASITPTISTAYENVTFTPVSGEPYQVFNLLPAINEAMFINDVSYKSLGIFQITLHYPLNQGTADVMARADLYLNAFDIGTNLVNGAATVKITDTPDIRVLGVVGDRYVVAISVNYKSYLKMV